jgi:hypothetical protein
VLPEEPRSCALAMPRAEPTKAGASEYNESQELENLQRVFQILSHQKPGAIISDKDPPKVSPDKLSDALKKLNYKCKRTDVEDMIWEVDEDCDGLISWDEFKAMFYRVRHDKSGWEPRRLFNVVEFMMHDKVRGAPTCPLALVTPSLPLTTPTELPFTLVCTFLGLTGPVWVH